MQGIFNVHLTGTERNVTRDGKSEYLYINCLQGNELKKVRVLDEMLMKNLESIPALTELSVLLEVHEGIWNDKAYISYKLISYDIVSNSGKKEFEKK